ncbi:MAG TPA: hypothetical protein VMZ53_08895 [Kofleriaceae bacterium]|nr:hypothetical protein [Kofleriaceae bacterium]
MKKFGLLMTVLAACGGDDGVQMMVDAKPMTVEHDLSCLNYTPPSVPMTIRLDGIILDFTTVPSPPTVPDTTLHVTSLDGATEITSATSDMDGKLTLTIPTTGVPTRFRYAIDATGFPKSRTFVSVGPAKDAIDPMRAAFPVVQQSRIDAIATALGETLDPTKGTLEVVMFDCSFGDYYAATPSIVEEPGLKWAMNGGANAWLPRATTLHHPNNRSESVAAAVNLTPGPKTFMLSDATTTIGPISFTIEADTYTTLIVQPGYPRQ